MNRTNNSISESVAEIVDQVIDDLSLKDKVAMANLEDDNIAIINMLMTDYIQSKLEEWFIHYGETDLTEPKEIVKEIWNRLRETHRIRIVR